MRGANTQMKIATKSERNGIMFRSVFIIIMVILLLTWVFEVFYYGAISRQIDIFAGRFIDYFADFQNVVGYSGKLDPYHNVVYGPQEKVYPPLSYLFAYLFSRLVDIDVYYETNYFLNMYQEPLFLFMFILYNIALAVSFYEILRHRLVGKRGTVILLSIVFLFSRPMMFTIERGNSMILSMIFTMCFIFNYDSGSKIRKEFGLISLAIAAALKITPALLGLLLVIEKKHWKDALRTVLYGLLFFFIPFLFLKGGMIENIKQLWLNIQADLNYYSKLEGCTFEACLYQIGVKIPGNIASILKWVVAGVLTLGCVMTKEKWKRIMMISLVLILTPAHSGDYCVLYIIPAAVLFLNEKEKSIIDLIIFLGMIFILQPVQTHLTQGTINCGSGLLIITLAMVIEAAVAVKNRMAAFRTDNQRVINA